MLVKMRRQDFDLLQDAALGDACFGTFIPMIRGKSETVKAQVYKQLTPGQQALFMFHAYYNHAKNSLAEFYWWTAHNLVQPKTWSALKSGLEYFKADELQKLLNEMEGILRTRNDLDGFEGFDVAYYDLDHDPELLASVRPLHAIFEEISPVF